MSYAHSVTMMPLFLNETLTATAFKATDENFNNVVVFINTNKILHKMILLYMPGNPIKLYLCNVINLSKFNPLNKIDKFIYFIESIYQVHNYYLMHL